MPVQCSPRTFSISDRLAYRHRTPAPGKADERFLLIIRYVEEARQHLGYLPGRTARACFYLVDGFRRTANPLCQLLTSEAEGIAPGLQPLAEARVFCTRSRGWDAHSGFCTNSVPTLVRTIIAQPPLR